ncbi:GT4 family glycosyltransferase PelF [Microbulbifer taiwanensis]|uniref:GT4 family glycosyltransferase PelF n=1 Tax=Microbulbifer taiwanensis TaxID=986746 RepID=A0ABW1YQA2_9GAMM|nr:GT4 family glycosyltransferase PelF [Microbulbifer taiwanensis]
MQAPTADIGLLLEGTYPYIRGGVSSWVHQIITGLPEFTFALVFLGGQKSDYGEMQYELPPNVKHLEVHYLMDSWQESKPVKRAGNREAFADVSIMQEQFKRDAASVPRDLLARVFENLGKEGGITHADFLHSEASWEVITDKYLKFCTGPSFVDYFWTVRTMHAPLFTLAKIADHMPSVRAIHSVSTGYAGLLGSILQSRRNYPYVLTEHGIYTKERKIDLAQAGWIKDPQEELSVTLHADSGYIREMWIRFYEVIGTLAYQAANPIVSLYEGNRERQVQDGAQRERTRVVPNGISLERFESVLTARPATLPKVLGLIGRVVPIKDIKTFIRAMRSICNEMPDAEGWIVGPEDEDPQYVQECRELVASLGLEDRVKFLGFQNIADIIPQLGLMVLTSISEALPLVILEAYASGLPCLATDVGSCRELIEGQNEEDRGLGPAGAVVPIADPDATADAALRLLRDDQLWHQAQSAGLERVRRYYTQSKMFDSYREIYRQTLEQSWPA